MECEAFSMKMDPALMESLLINLIDNALKATDAGGSIWVKAYEKAGKRSLRCRIPEWGSRRKNWERSQMHSIWWTNHEAEKKGGSGLGLALCVKVAEIHGGFLKIESQPGEGTTVRAIF